MTCGDAARPASCRATASTGRKKNRKNVAVATTHRTRMPVSMRLMRNRVKAMSACPRGVGRRGVRQLAVFERDVPLATLAAGREQPLRARVHGVPDPVPE